MNVTCSKPNHFCQPHATVRHDSDDPADVIIQLDAQLLNLLDALYWDRHPLHWRLGVPVLRVSKRVHGLDAVFSSDVVPDGSDIGQVAFDVGL